MLLQLHEEEARTRHGLDSNLLVSILFGELHGSVGDGHSVHAAKYREIINRQSESCIFLEDHCSLTISTTNVLDQPPLKMGNLCLLATVTTHVYFPGEPPPPDHNSTQ